MPFEATIMKDYGVVGPYRVRLMQDNKRPDATPVLDVREYIASEKFEGFTRRGIRVGSEEGAQLLISALEDILNRGLFRLKSQNG